MKTIKRTLTIFKKVLLGILLFLAFYITSAFLLSKITVNSDEAQNQAQEVEIFIKTNGVHTDVIVPIKNEFKDWSTMIKVEKTQSNDTTMTHIALGWGDKGFYLDTPEWSDLKVSTAFNAAFALGSSAMHTTFCKSVKESQDCVKIKISPENYQKLIAYIEDSFQLDSNSNPQFIQATTYGKNDCFYEAKGKYNLFHTCNTWANNALKSANQKAAFWTVTDSGIFCHYQ